MSKSSTAPSILSTDLVIDGTVTSDGEIQLDGQIEGDIRAGVLIVGEKASVKGEVVADHVTIRGRVIGTVRGRQVTLASSARIEGDIFHANLSVESGAYFDGQCRHSSDPLTSTPSESKSSSTPVSAPRTAEPAADTKPSPLGPTSPFSRPTTAS